MHTHKYKQRQAMARNIGRVPHAATTVGPVPMWLPVRGRRDGMLALYVPTMGAQPVRHA